MGPWLNWTEHPTRLLCRQGEASDREVGGSKQLFPKKLHQKRSASASMGISCEYPLGLTGMDGMA